MPYPSHHCYRGLLQNCAIASAILNCFSDHNCTKVKLVFDPINDLTDVLVLDMIFPKAAGVGGEPPSHSVMVYFNLFLDIEREISVA